MIKTNNEGDPLWTGIYPTNDFSILYSVQQTSDGGYIAVGYTGWLSCDDVRIYLVKTDSVGNLEWNRTFLGSFSQEGYCIQLTGDGGYIIAGKSHPIGPGYYDGYLLKTNEIGDTLWSMSIGGNHNDYFLQAKPTYDEGYIVVGYTFSYGAGGYDAWLVRLDAGPILIVTLTPQNPPIIIPASGGYFLFDTQIHSAIPESVFCDVWTEVELPNGNIHNPLLLRQNLMIPSGFGISGTIRQMVPSFAPPGDYIYTGYAGTYPDSVVDGDSFRFTKLEGQMGAAIVQDWGVCDWFEWQGVASVTADSPMLSGFPNPFNPAITISFALPEPGKVHLSVYDIAGRLVATLLDGNRTAGVHEFTFDAGNLVSGIYIYRLEAGNYTAVRKMVLMK